MLNEELLQVPLDDTFKEPDYQIVRAANFKYWNPRQAHKIA